LVDIDHVGWFIQKKIGRRSILTVEVDIHSKKLQKVLIFEKNCEDVPQTTSAFLLGLGFDTMRLEFWVLLEKAQVFADGCKDLFEALDLVIVLALLARQRWRAGVWTRCCVVKCVVPVTSISDDLFSGMYRGNGKKGSGVGA